MSKLLIMPMGGIPDALDRDKALNISQSWIVEAPAGSGKTGLLIQRYLQLLTDPNVSEPEQVLAITFTRAATEEIRGRVVRELTRATENAETKTEYDRATRTIAKAVLSRDSQRGWDLLDNPSRLRVRTIDAVCAEITRSLPLLCGGNGSLTPVEDATVLYAEAARRTWMWLGGEDAALSEALRLLLLRRDGDLNSCMALVAEMLAHREQWGSLIPVQEEELDEASLDVFTRKRLDEALEQVICATLSHLVQVFPEQLLRRITTLAESLSERAGYNGRPSPIAICREFKTAPTAAAEHLMHWRALRHLLISPSSKTWRKRFSTSDVRFELTPQDRSSLKDIALELQQSPELPELLNDAAALPSPRFPAELWPLTKALFLVLRRALADLQAVFLETSQCDFVEPALLARNALKHQDGPANLQSALGTELQHLLVDEMQDTSAHQYDLIERLTEGWERQQKTVFLVGDPKQSIYLFRQARVERFNETMRSGLLGKLSVGPLQLSANFRSQAGLVEAFNEDFTRVFPENAKRAEDVSYVPAIATRPVSIRSPLNTGSVWHLSVAAGSSVEGRQPSQEQTSKNARAISEIIEAWQARPLPDGRTSPWKIAVLVQSRASLGPVLRELRKRPILVRAVKIDTLDERPEILDLLALTRALLHPADRTAWLSVLHAPWCGLGLSDLHTLTGEDDSAYLDRTIMSLVLAHRAKLTLDGATRLGRVWPALNAGVSSAGRLRLPERVERTWRSLRGDTYLDDTALRNVNSFFELLQMIDQEEGEVVDSELLRRLNRLYASSDSQVGAVDLITIHGAKGLEWDVVLVPALERRSAANTPRLFEWEELSHGGVVLAPINGKGEDAIELTKWLNRVRSKREAAERKRLFYVACTRAREELHLFGIAARSQTGSVSANARSLLHASWHAAERYIAHPSDIDAPLKTKAGILPSLAARSDEREADVHRPMLERLPLAAMPSSVSSSSLPSVASHTETSTHLSALRTHGSSSARQLGTTVHLFLEEVVNRLATGTELTQMALEVATWRPRIRAVLRGTGLSPSIVERSVEATLKALRGTLQDPIGRWMAIAAVDAHSELAIVAKEQGITKQRIDRVFRAGATPGEPGSTHLWIIDYKTTAFTGESKDPAVLKQFLEVEKTRHKPQLERYAQLLNTSPMRLGLWFPLLGKLAWWSHDSAAPRNEHAQVMSQLPLFVQEEN